MPWLVAVRAQVGLQVEKLCLRVQLESQGVPGVPLAPATVSVLPPELTERIEVRGDHSPPRTARTKLLLLLSLLFTLPLLKFTFQAFVGLLALDVDDQ